ncbi:hypothetical protein [Teredinibacter haidensis]|uniref:hypothetical protein n=1 Tax=Teredinibacter haidensis TaxID=2731755 RepID=UPI000948D597|nr:hypothetical protein [Teredinibacter haidensis]
MTQKISNTKLLRPLDQSLRELTPDTLDALANARQKALAQVPQSNRSATNYWLSGAVCAALLAGVLVFTYPPKEKALDSTPQLADLEWLMEKDELELMQADLQFYQWVDFELGHAG